MSAGIFNYRKFVNFTISLVAIVSISQSTLSQALPSSYFQLELSTGVSHLNHFDRTVSRLTYQGNGFPIYLGLNWQKNNRIHSIAIDYQKTGLQSQTSSPLLAENYIAGLNWHLKRRLGSIGNNRGAYFWGFMLGIDFLGQTNQYNTNMIKKLTGVLSVNIAPAGGFTWPLKQNLSLNLNVNIPILSWVIRSGYTTTSPDKLLKEENIGLATVLSSGNFLLPNQFFNFNSSLNLNYQLSGRLMSVISYKFSFLKIQNPQLLTSIQDQFKVGLLISF